MKPFWKSLFIPLVVVAVLPSRYAKCDNIDIALLRESSKIVKKLEDSGYKNVGVLPFRVQKPNKRPSFTVGLLNRNLALRLENALILGMNPRQQPFGVTHDAAEVAIRNLSEANYRTPTYRTRLFYTKYPTVTGEKVFVDAFLCGKAIVKPDEETIRIEIEAFDITQPAIIKDIATFECKTDDFVLTDASITFNTKNGRRVFARGMSEDDIVEGQTIENANKNVVVKQRPSTIVSRSTESVSKKIYPFPIRLKVLYNGREFPRRPDAENEGPYNEVIADPQEGERVTFRITNLTNEKLGVVITVNGVSTLHGEKGQPDQMTRWVLPPRKEYEIKGFHNKDSKTYRSIVGLPNDISKKKFKDFGGRNAGLIHVYVFREVDDKELAKLSAPPSGMSLRETEAVSTAKEMKKISLSELQKIVKESAKLKSARGLMTIGAEGQELLRTLSLGQTRLVRTKVIRYYRP